MSAPGATAQPVATHNFTVKIPDIDTIGWFTDCHGLEIELRGPRVPRGRQQRLRPSPAGAHPVPEPHPLARPDQRGRPAEVVLGHPPAGRAQGDHADPQARRGRPDVDVRRRVPGQVDRPQPRRNGPSGIATETLEIAHSGLKMACRPCRSPRASSAPGWRSTASDAIECAFNPQSYTVSKTNIWNFKPTTGVDLPDGEFGGGLPRRITLQLLLDVSLQAPDQSVKDTTNKLLKMMETGERRRRRRRLGPPFVTFRWGSVDLPKAVPVSLDDPVRRSSTPTASRSARPSTSSSPRPRRPRPRRRRARSAQNPTTRAQRGPARPHVVRDGDSLPVDRLRRLRRPDALARDRRGQRHRRPAARCAAAPSSRSRASTHEPDDLRQARLQLRHPRRRRRRSTQTLKDRITEIRVVDHLRLPDVCTIRITVPARRRHRRDAVRDRQGGRGRASAPSEALAPGRRCSRGRSSRSSPTSAPAAARSDPRLTTARTSCTARATTRTFQNQTSSDIVTAGRSARRA